MVQIFSVELEAVGTGRKQGRTGEGLEMSHCPNPKNVFA